MDVAEKLVAAAAPRVAPLQKQVDNRVVTCKVRRNGHGVGKRDAENVCCDKSSILVAAADLMSTGWVNMAQRSLLALRHSLQLSIPMVGIPVSSRMRCAIGYPAYAEELGAPKAAA